MTPANRRESNASMNSSRLALPSSEMEPAAEAESSVASLFLAWSNRYDTAYCSSTASGAVQQDFGLWLLRGVLFRRDGWARFSARFAAKSLISQPASKWWYDTSKRMVDIVVSLVLLFLLVPVFVLIALLIKLDSSGPAFFRQSRVGKDGEKFLLWKFRSMKQDVPVYENSPTTSSDPRITRVGHLISRMSLDELPQLLNVLRGKMSLVGPRPEMSFIVDRYSDLERRRLAVKPGITGLWQVSPARAFPIHQNLHYDLHYIHHRNLVLDAAILLHTVVAVIRGMGAV